MKPISERDLIPAVEIALGQSERVKALSGNIKDLQAKMEMRKKVEKAKGILMQSYKISEEEAYEKLRNYSMKNRKPMKEVANYIIEFGRLGVRSSHEGA
ncbi:ANTAR domain-containing response regulator [Caldalkalibacillus mannanilyticus]|uniref:ANTAR domain-containing response regulator n=1 Tax=Caldalkalibacillus mannanilyticus TaxID=1418 RepID=UPI000B235D05